MMRLLRDYRFHWWQVGLLKLAVLAFGILLGAYLYRFFLGSQGLMALLWILFLAPVVYLIAVLPRLGA